MFIKLFSQRGQKIEITNTSGQKDRNHKHKWSKRSKSQTQVVKKIKITNTSGQKDRNHKHKWSKRPKSYEYRRKIFMEYFFKFMHVSEKIGRSKPKNLNIIIILRTAHEYGY